MGKNSKVKYPSYTGGTVSINGEVRATAKKKGKKIVSDYNMPETEKGIYDYAQNSLLSSLPEINVFSPETRNDINSQLEAYQNSGIQSINDIYNPMITNLKNDISSRFGNLNNSMFFDNLNTVEKSRANAISDLAQNIQAQRSSLYNNELAYRYNYLNFMNNMQNQINNSTLAYLGLAQNNANAGNAYNQNAYNANVANANAQNSQYSQYAQMAMQLLPLLFI